MPATQPTTSKALTANRLCQEIATEVPPSPSVRLPNHPFVWRCGPINLCTLTCGLRLFLLTACFPPRRNSYINCVQISWISDGIKVQRTGFTNFQNFNSQLVGICTNRLNPTNDLYTLQQLKTKTKTSSINITTNFVLKHVNNGWIVK